METAQAGANGRIRGPIEILQPPRGLVDMGAFESEQKIDLISGSLIVLTVTLAGRKGLR